MTAIIDVTSKTSNPDEIRHGNDLETRESIIPSYSQLEREMMKEQPQASDSPPMLKFSTDLPKVFIAYVVLYIDQLRVKAHSKI